MKRGVLSLLQSPTTSDKAVNSSEKEFFTTQTISLSLPQTHKQYLALILYLL